MKNQNDDIPDKIRYLGDAVKALVGGNYHMKGAEDDYEIVYLSGQTPPSQDALDAKCAELKSEFEGKKYQRDRKLEYPPMADYLDGIVKNDQTQIDKYITDCNAVKTKYPKPE